ncbi:MAG: hypothetical protein HYW37_02010 [Candidatus Colwellbacteria bacterium]|nr:hypothetical protein [Candidatus Colwellbacteria bacterium]
MPGRFFIQKFLRRAADRGCKYALVEVTSEGVREYRHRFIDFDAAIILNLHPEHIESHGGFLKYRDAKLQFFRDVSRESGKSPKYFFVNSDDQNAKYFVEAAGRGEVILFSKSGIESKIPGEFHKYNLGAAESFLKMAGVKQPVIKRALRDFAGIPGRLEFVTKSPFKVVVDYAHTPDSLRAVYETLSSGKIKPPGAKMICVLGSCGGGRDRWKRPKLGEIAYQYCDRIILTNEDPYDEDPTAILREIKSGISAKKLKSTEEVLDRGSAVKRAISLAGKGDVVVITGKGSEPYIHIEDGERIPWSDKQAVLEAILEISDKRRARV